MKKLPIMALLTLFCATSLLGSGGILRVPPYDLKFEPASTSDLLSLISPAANAVEAARWNNIVIRLPEAIPYRDNLVIRGVASVTADIPPSHIAFIVKGNHQKTGHARVRLAKGTVEFRVPLSELLPDSKAANTAPLNAQDEILELRVFASFPEATNSSFTLESLTLTAAK